MLAVGVASEIFSKPLGQRGGITEVTRFTLDSSRLAHRQLPELGISARSRAYPSPPMSGSPPLPPNTTSEAGDQGLSRGDYRVPGSQNAPQTDLGAPLHRIMSGLPPPPPMPPPQASTYQYGGSERAFAYRRPEESMPMAMPISSSYPLGTGQPSHPAPQLYAPMAGPAQGAGLNHLPSVPHHPYAAQMPPQSAEENQPFTSPKSQRKTKGHVASACVPCKKAHLR